tara:strand:- start:14164 stop:15087 length:924 start_codon:yes stop_codon:yes gene_type:complete
MKNMRNILVGIDFSAPSDNALREAARIAKWDHAKLTAVNVFDEETVHELAVHAPGIRDEIMAEAGGRIDAYVENVLGADHGVRSQLIVGKPLQAVIRAVSEYHADLLVLGSHGRDSSDDHQIGHLASRWARKVPVNTLLVRERQIGRFRKVVACIDFSQNSAKAAAQAVHLCQQDQAELVFLHVHRPLTERLSSAGFFTAVGPEVLGRDADDLDAERIRQTLLDSAKSLVAQSGGCEFSTEVIMRLDARRAILEYLQESNADLVVLGTRGHTRLRNLLLGATAERVIHRASCSVLVVKPDGFDYELS